MGKKYKDIEIGDTFGRWKVIGYSGKKSKCGSKHWLCQCNCKDQTIKEVMDSSLKNGKSKSCGCMTKESLSNKSPANSKNLIGQIFNNLTVISKSNKRTSDGKIKWICQCSCGNTTIVDTSSLIRGGTKSCGCLLQDKSIQLREDLTNQRFGALTVIECVGSIKKTDHSRPRVMWKCKCDCGNETDVAADKLKSGSTKSCGCQIHKFNDLTGQEFGELKVIAYGGSIYENGGNVKYWSCKCSCGKIITIRQNALVSGGQQSCGCKHNYKGENKIKKILGDLHINYQTQYSFDDCKSKIKLRFDFGILDDADNLLFLIEYDGIGHYEPINFGGKGDKHAKENLSTCKFRDVIKNKYCEENNIYLLRIPYWEYDNLENYLLEKMSGLHINNNTRMIS